MDEPLIENLLKQHPEQFDSLLKKNNQWQIQIIYTQIDRDKNNRPHFTNYYFNVDPNRYFYPASTVKMPAAFLALHKLNELGIPGLNKNSVMLTEATYPGHTAVIKDTSSANGKPTIAHYIKKVFLVSDNDAHNRLCEFLGQEYFNNTLHRMGYSSVQILHRLSVNMSDDQNRHTNPIKFYDENSKLLYEQPLVNSKLIYEPRQTFYGKGYYSGGKLVEKPFDFSNKNRISLEDLHSILKAVIFPQAVSKKQRFNLTNDDYRFLYKYMSMKPGESDYPRYDTSHYTDAYVKFLMFGGGGPMPDTNIRIFNKVGDAYGFLTDVAYIVDYNSGVEFMLSATIHCNSDGIYNDDKYDYDTVGFPFMRNLGQVIYQHEKKRSKKYAPVLMRP